jgi:hypothetical protein
MTARTRRGPSDRLIAEIGTYQTFIWRNAERRILPKAALSPFDMITVM